MTYGRPPLPDEPGHPSNFRAQYVTRDEAAPIEASENQQNHHTPAAEATPVQQAEQTEQPRLVNVHTQDNVTTLRNRRAQTVLMWVMWGTAILGVTALFAVLLTMGDERDERGRGGSRGDSRGGSRERRFSDNRSVERWAEQFFDDDERDDRGGRDERDDRGDHDERSRPRKRASERASEPARGSGLPPIIINTPGVTSSVVPGLD